MAAILGFAPYALQLLESLPALIQAGRDVSELITHGTSQIKLMQSENRGPTVAEWEELDARVRTLRTELHS